jgi:hypothetical protein
MDARKFRRCTIHEPVDDFSLVWWLIEERAARPTCAAHGLRRKNTNAKAAKLGAIRPNHITLENRIIGHNYSRRDLCLCTRIRCSSRQPTHRHPFLY